MNLVTINTVLGQIDTNILGFTLSHEHVLVSSAGIQQIYPEFIDRQATINDAISHLRDAYSE